MNRLLLTSATLGALIIAPALAQQPGSSQPNPAEVAPTQRAPATTQNPSPTATQRSASDSQSTVSMQADILAETLQGLTVYTTKTDNNNAASNNNAAGSSSGARTDSTGSVRTDAAGRPLATGSVSSSNSTASAMPTGTEARLLTKAELKTMTDQAQNIGEVNDLLIGLDGKVNQIIVDVGGFLGVGERSITLNWNELKLVKTNDGDVVAFIDKSKAELNGLPQYQAPAKR